MNKAVTEGLNLSPTEFVDGLEVWSSEDGTIGTVTYATSSAGSLVASDPDFGDCLELVTAENPQRVRYMGETPLLPGCYLEVEVRVKLVSGPVPQVRIAGNPRNAVGDPVTGLTTTGPLVTLSDYGRVYTVRAIIGSGARTGVDMVWGTNPVYGHLGLDVVGSTGAVVRVEDISISDQTSVFHRDLMDWVDVRDYGALGDGVTDDATAFETADADAQGREVLVPDGVYFLDRDITMTSPVRFEGTVVQPPERFLSLRANFDYPAYARAFGDETLGLKKALQALINFADHEVLDLKGRRIDLTEPIDVAATVPNISTLKTRRVIRNGILRASGTTAFEPDVVVGTASYSLANDRTLTNVENIGTIAVGSLVEGAGVGREIYVRAKDESTGELTLSQPLYGASGTQSYTFTRYKYLLDFSGFEEFTKLMVDSIHFAGLRKGCGIMLPPQGIWITVRNCWFFQAGLRGITSIGTACAGITIEQNEFISSDGDLPTTERKSIAFNTNANDAKIRDNRCVELRHFGIIGGNGTMMTGNHFWQIDLTQPGDRTAGVVFTDRNPKVSITGNYIDNHFIEFTNEYRADAINSSGLSFGKTSISDNVFTGFGFRDWFEFIVYSPIGTDCYLDGVTVTGNVFHVFGGDKIDRVDGVNTALGTMDYTRFKNVVFEANSYRDVRNRTESPFRVEVTQGTAAASWTIDASAQMPFGGHAMGVDSVVPHGPLRNGANNIVHIAPWVQTQQGVGSNAVSLEFGQAVTGTVQARIRVDNPN